jgi:hypothetical protein
MRWWRLERKGSGRRCSTAGVGRNRGLTNSAASSDHEIRPSSFASNTQNTCAISSSTVAVGARVVDPLRTPTTAAWCCTKRQGENQIRIRQIEYHSITQTLTKKVDQIGARKSEQGVSHLLLEWPPTPPSRRSPARAPVSPTCHRRPTPSSRWHSAVGRRWEDLGGTKPRRRGTARIASRAGRGAATTTLGGHGRRAWSGGQGMRARHRGGPRRCLMDSASACSSGRTAGRGGWRGFGACSSGRAGGSRRAPPRWLERIRCVLIGEGGRIVVGERGKEAGAVYIRLLIVSRDMAHRSKGLFGSLTNLPYFA